MAKQTEGGLNGLARSSEWVRALAGRMVADPHEADDLAQDAWVAVLSRSDSKSAKWAKSAKPRSWRGWIGGVLRNQRKQSARTAARRRDHESRASAENAERTGRAAPPADDAVERAELAHAVLAAVLALDEPFREVVLLRYGEGLPAKEVARRLSVPQKTVESRARRGLGRLRERWERDHGSERPGWLDALAVVAVPLAPLPLPVDPSPSLDPLPPAASTTAASAATPLVTLGALAMQMKIAIGAAVLVGGAGSLYWLQDRNARIARPDDVVVAAPRAGSDVAPTDAVVYEPIASETDTSRDALPASVEPSTAATTTVTPTAAEEARRIRGRVYDVDARGVPGVRVAWYAGSDKLGNASPDLVVQAGADGSFDLTVGRGSGDIAVDEPHLTTLVHGQVQGERDAEMPLIVASIRRLGGRVVDEAGRPLPGADVTMELPPGFLGRFHEVLDATVVNAPAATSDEQGAFLWERAALVPGAGLMARLDGFEEVEIDAPLGDAYDLELVLVRPRDPNALRGRVVDVYGTAQPGAWVTLGAKSAVTDASGEFSLSREDAHDAHVIQAVKNGHQAARAEVPSDAVTGEPAWPDWIELQLGPEPLTMKGRVVDADGEPRAGIRVWIDDPTPFGLVGDDEIQGQVEFLLGNDAVPAGDLGDAYWHSTMTDAEGGFELPGLMDRDYRLRLLDAKRQETLVSGPFHGSDPHAEVTFPREPLGSLKGQVVTRTGDPLEGVTLFLQCDAFGGIWMQGGKTTTDAEGRFAFEGVGNVRLSLMVRGDDIVPDWIIPEGDPRAEEHTLVADRLCHLKVELADAGRADGYRVLDAQGESVKLYQIGAGGITYFRQATIVEGLARTIGVPESGESIVLVLGDEEVARIPLRLDGNELNTVLL